jgi:hypothetical protein
LAGKGIGKNPSVCQISVLCSSASWYREAKASAGEAQDLSALLSELPCPRHLPGRFDFRSIPVLTFNFALPAKLQAFYIFWLLNKLQIILSPKLRVITGISRE